MAFDYTVSNFEYNGGGVYFFKINIDSYSAPTGYADYTEIGGTDGVSLEISTDQEEVRIDQAFAAVDIFRKATSAMFTLTVAETTLTKLLIAAGMDYTDTTNVLTSGNTEFSVYEGADDLTTSRAYFGAQDQNIYFDIVLEKVRTHKDKQFGVRFFKATPTGNVSWSAKHEEKSFYDIEFQCLGSDLAASHNGNIGYFFDEA